METILAIAAGLLFVFISDKLDKKKPKAKRPHGERPFPRSSGPVKLPPPMPQPWPKDTKQKQGKFDIPPIQGLRQYRLVRMVYTGRPARRFRARPRHIIGRFRKTVNIGPIWRKSRKLRQRSVLLSRQRISRERRFRELRENVLYWNCSPRLC